MTDYTKTTDFTEKDSLATGTIAKRLKGSEIDTELDNIASAIATKEDSANKDQASGYAGLDASTLVDSAQMGTGTGTSAKYLRGDRTWQAISAFATAAHVHTAAVITYDNSTSEMVADDVQSAIDEIAAAAGIGGATSHRFVLSGDVENFNLADRLGTVPGTSITVSITIAQGVKVTSRSTTTPAMDLTGLHTGSTINLTNLGLIMGCGGDGGNGGSEYNDSGGPGIGPYFGGDDGKDGGIALKGPGSGITLNITNIGGYILGGGGGGAGGGFVGAGGDEAISAGGGGGGAGGGRGGEADPVIVKGGGSVVRGADGGNGAMDRTGTAATGGTGVKSGGTSVGNGGAGGTWGADGSDGTGTNHGTGGTAGLAVSKVSGTVTFVSGGTSPHVKGTVS